MSLDNNVYKIPSFSKMGYEVSQKQSKELKSKLGVDAAEEAFNASKHSLTGDRKVNVENMYGLFEEAAIQAQESKSPEDIAKARDYRSQLNAIMGISKTHLNSSNEAYSKAQANGFQGYSMGADEISKGYTDFQNKKIESKVEGGALLIKEGDNWVPWSQSSAYSSEINPNNSYIIPQAVEQGKFVLSDSFIENNKGIIQNAGNLSNAKEQLTDEFAYQLENSEPFRNDVAAAYAIKQGKIDGKDGKFSGAELDAAIQRYNKDPKFAQEANEDYLRKINGRTEMILSRGSGESSGVYQDVVDVDGQEIEANFQVFPDNKRVGSMTAVGISADGEYYVRTRFGEGVEKNTKATPSQIAKIKESGFNINSLKPQQEAPVAEEEAPVAEEVKNVVDALPVPTEEQDNGIPNDGLNLGRQTGLAPPAPAADESVSLLPDYHYKNLIDFEGGVATSEKDNAYQKNPDAPMIDGADGKVRAHTNRGVQYNIFKDWAESNSISKSDWKDRFLNLTEKEAKNIADGFAKKSGASNFEEPVLRSLFTQNAWGTGKVWAADFKSGRSKEYRAVLDWLQEGTGLSFKNVNKINKEESDAISKMYNEDPKGFITEYTKRKKQHFGTLDDSEEYGAGWNRRADNLRDAMLESIA